MIHPQTELFVRGDGVGAGVRATEPLPRGTVLWVRDVLDVVMAAEALDDLPPSLRAQVDRLGYRDASGRWILCWDAGKHVNHSCDPVMRGVGHDAMIAVRDVATGEEITCDYAECNLEQPLRCACGAATCRGVIEPTTEGAVWKRWQVEVEGAVQAGRALAQPLAEVAIEAEQLVAVLSGEHPVPRLAEVGIRPNLDRT